MNWFGKFLTSSIGRKFVMGLTGIALILFLIVHCGINALIFLNDGGVAFNEMAHIMGTNIVIRTMEIGLFVGFILHIVQAYMLSVNNAKARPAKYAVNKPGANSKWYSRSMTLLGTLILLFLIIHLKHFWVVSRFIGLEETSYGAGDLYIEMQEVFSVGWVVVVYLLGVFSLGWHLLHGFQSAFQTFGWNTLKYKGLIRGAGLVYTFLIPTVFAAMPLAFYFEWIK
jgi:succinate dehydrogenase / fumarate reductase cytochrome b subunit